MNFNLLIENVTSPALLFFILGIIAVEIKSDLEIPQNSYLYIYCYRLVSKEDKNCLIARRICRFYGMFFLDLLLQLSFRYIAFLF